MVITALLSGRKLDLVRWQLLDVYTAAQRLLVNYKSEAATYENLVRTAERDKRQEISGTHSPERLSYAESQLSKQAKRLLE